MKLFKHLGGLYILLLFPLLSFSQSTLNGKVSDKKGNPIPFAIAFLKGAKVGTFTDTLGNFSLTTAATGPDTILITCIGYDEILRGITLENKTYPLVFLLKEPYTTIGEVVITAGLIEANDERSVAVLKPLDIVTTAGGQGDIVGAIQTLPGVQRNGGDQTGLMVRGGDVSESSMIIDGMIAQNAFNSDVPGVSQRSRFNPFQFKGTSFSSGGYTARYGQALSGILDLQTNDLPSKSDVNFGANLAGISLSGSKLMGKNAVEYAGSMQHLGPYFAINPSNVNFYTAPQGGSFSTRFISKLDDNKGIFKMNFSQSYTKSGIQIPDPTTAGAKVNFDLANENTYFNTSLKYKASEKLKYYTAFSFSNNTDNIAMGMFDIYRADGRVQARAEMNYEFHRKFNLLAGTELQRISYTLKYDTLVGGYQETMSAAYLEGEYKVSSKFGIKPGIRAEYSQLLARANGSPRVAFAYKTGANSQVSFAGGMFYQTAPSQYLIQGYRPGFQQSIHYMLNYQMMKENRTFRLEGYYKSYDQLVKENGVPYTPNQYRFNFGQVDNSGGGYAQGIDVFWRDKKTVKNLDYWISYSYIDTKRIYQNYISKVTPDYVSTHNLNIIAKYMVEKIQTNFSASYNYSSGRPYYNPNSTEFLSDKVTAYQIFAITAAYLKSFKKVFAVFYLSVDNIFNMENVLGYRYSNNGAERYPVIPPMYRSIFIGMNLSFSQFTQDEL
jgi:hypothetical protein